MSVNHVPRRCVLEHRLAFLFSCIPCLLQAGQLEATRATQESVVVGQVENALSMLRSWTYPDVLVPKR